MKSTKKTTGKPSPAKAVPVDQPNPDGPVAAEQSPASEPQARAAKPGKAAKTVKSAAKPTSAPKVRPVQGARKPAPEKAAKAPARKAGKKAVRFRSTVKAETKKAPKPGRLSATAPESDAPGHDPVKLLDSKLVYEGPLFRVMSDHLIEPSGRESRRDVIRHNGSVVILAIQPGKKKKDPWVVIERQYRHAAGQFLWELPAGKLDAGETALAGAQRELIEETGYHSQNWSPLVEYFASPGFLGESMKVFLAEGLTAGDAHPEEDENIEFRLVKLSELLDMVDAGKIIDGKTLTTVLLYARKLGLKRKR